MHRAGTESFTLRQGSSWVLLIALYVRDRLELPNLGTGTVPPALLYGTITDAAILVPGGEVARLGAQWVLWWDRLVDSLVEGLEPRTPSAPSARTALPAQARLRALRPRKVGSSTPRTSSR